MAIPKITKKDVLDALKFINQNGVPDRNISTKYNLISDEGKKYPSEYVVAVADHLANGNEITTDEFVSVETKHCLESLGFTIEKSSEKRSQQ